MNTTYVPSEILRNLPYEFRIPINDFDDLELVLKEGRNSTDPSDPDEEFWN